MSHSWLRCSVVLIWLALGLVLSSVEAAKAGSVKLVAGNDYYPFTGQGLPTQGVATALVRAVFAAVGDEVVLDFKPWQHGYRMTLAGRYEGTFPYIDSAKRRKECLFSEPFLQVPTLLFSNAVLELSFESLADLDGLTYCLPEGYAPPLPLVSRVAAGKLQQERAASVESCARRIVYGEADFFVLNAYSASYALKAAGLESFFKVSERPLSTVGHYFLVPRTHPQGEELVARFNEGLRILKKNGSYPEIVSRLHQFPSSRAK